MAIELSAEQLDGLCTTLYESADAATRAQAQSTLSQIADGQNALQQCFIALESCQSAYAQLFASGTLMKLLSKANSPITLDERNELRTYLLRYIVSRPKLPQYVLTSLCQLFARLTKLGWFDFVKEEYIFRTSISEIMKLTLQFKSFRHPSFALLPLQNSIELCMTGVQLFEYLVLEMNQSQGLNSLMRHRKVASSFRDFALFDIFMMSLNMLRTASDNVKCIDNDQLALVERLFNVCLHCLNFDFIGSMIDETDENPSVQVPASWRPAFMEQNVPQLFFDLYAALPHSLSAKALACIVQLVSIRRTIFNNDERQNYLNSLMIGLQSVFENSQPLSDPTAYHEFCRLISRLKQNYQLTELTRVTDYSKIVRALAEFTITSIRMSTVASNSLHYLLSFWGRMVTSTPYVKNSDNPHLLETLVPDILDVYVTSRAPLVAGVIGEGLDDPLEDLTSLHQQLDQLAVIARCNYERAAALLQREFDQAAQDFHKLAHDATHTRLVEGRLTWLVYLIAAAISGRVAFNTSCEHDLIDGDLLCRVLQLMQMKDSRLPDGRNEQLEFAFLYHLEQFRKIYISDQVQRTSKVYERLATALGLNDESAVLALYVRKIVTNLKWWSGHERLVADSLNMLNDLSIGYSCVRKLVKLPDIQFLFKNHTDDNFTLLSPCDVRSMKSRTVFYSAITRLVAVHYSNTDSEVAFEAFLEPLVERAERINWNEPVDLVKRQLIGLFRDVRGVAHACSAKVMISQLFDWIYPAVLPLVLRAVSQWATDPDVTTAALKLMLELCNNRSQRLNFDNSSPKAILLFQQASKLICEFGNVTLSHASSVPKEQAYKLFYKGASTCFAILKATLNGGYVNFGVFRLYGDGCLDNALNMFVKMVMAIPREDVLVYSKLSRNLFQVLENLSSDHKPFLSNLPPDQFARILELLYDGLVSIDATICASCCASLDAVCTYLYGRLTRRRADANSARVQNGGDSAGSAMVTLRPEVGAPPEGDNCISCINAHPHLLAMPESKQAAFGACFSVLMHEVDRNLTIKNRDTFTQNLSSFRRDVANVLKTGLLTTESTLLVEHSGAAKYGNSLEMEETKAVVGIHGFPQRAACFAYDPELSLLAIGTRHGEIRVLGAPGVYLEATQPDEKHIAHIFFIPNQGRIITHCFDGTLHLWEINLVEGGGRLQLQRSVDTQDRMKHITAVALQSCKDGGPACCGGNGQSLGCDSAENRYRLLLGTESGNVYEVPVDTFEIHDYVIYSDCVAEKAPTELSKSAGPVESLCCASEGRLLIGFERGLLALFDCADGKVLQAWVTGQGLRDICWNGNDDRFATSHNDGSYILWKVGDEKPVVQASVPFGPFPCKPIDRIVWRDTIVAGDELLVMVGGMPRASFGDKNAVAVQRKHKQKVLDLSSPVVDVLTMDNDMSGSGDPAHTLLILCEEELVAVDLLHPEWAELRLPYLWPQHASPVTAAAHASCVNKSVMDTIELAGKDMYNRTQRAATGAYSSRCWPITGGKIVYDENAANVANELLITGHEDGSVKLWTFSEQGAMQQTLVLHTAALFDGFTDPHASANGADEDEWPPFRKVGVYDPFSDDPRFAVQRIGFDPNKGSLLVGGTAGQATLWNLCDRHQLSCACPISDIPCITTRIVADSEHFTWKGNERLQCAAENTNVKCVGYRPKLLVQLDPPAAVTALTMAEGHAGEMLLLGTAHGFALVDIERAECIVAKCLLTVEEMQAHAAGALDGAMTRFKSFKKTLRESFRRRRRHQTPEPGQPKNSEGKSPEKSPQKEKEGSIEAPATAEAGTPQRGSPSKGVRGSPAKRSEVGSDVIEVEPVERHIAARAELPTMASMVRCAMFASTHATTANELADTLWIGTNGGLVQMYLLTPYVSPDTAAPGAEAAQTEGQPADEQGQQGEQTGAETDAANTDAIQSVDGAEIQPAADAPADSPAAAKPAPSERATLAKEIRLRHGAPVLHLAVLASSQNDPQHGEQTIVATSAPVGILTEETGEKSASDEDKKETAASAGHHRLLVCSEEQLKSFALPTLKPYRHKYKLTAHEGARVRKAVCTKWAGRSGSAAQQQRHCFVMVMANTGEVHVFGAGNMRRYGKAQCLQSGDVSGIASTVLTSAGCALCLRARGTEWHRFNVCAGAQCRKCVVELPDGIRPPLKAEPEKEDKREEIKEKERNETENEGPPAAAESTEKENSPSPAPAAEVDRSLNASSMTADQTIDSIRDFTLKHEPANPPPPADRLNVVAVSDWIIVEKTPEPAPEASAAPIAPAESPADKHNGHCEVQAGGDAVHAPEQQIGHNGEEQPVVNGNHAEEDDEIAKLKQGVKEQMKLDPVATAE